MLPMSTAVVTDSTSDLPKKITEHNKITVVPVYLNLDNQTFLDEVDMSREEFYKRLPGLNIPPTTSSPSINDFQKVYQELIHSGVSGIISIHIAESLSNTINSARKAAESFPGFPISIIDSGNLSLGTGLLAIAAVEMAQASLSQQEIIEKIENQAKRTWSFALLDTLEYLHRGGRLSLVQYQIGRILKIKPVLVMHEGSMKLEKAFSFRGAMKRTVEYVTEKLIPVENAAFIHAAALEKIDPFKQMLSGVLPSREHMISEVTPAISVHVGPGAIGLVVVQKEKD